MRVHSFVSGLVLAILLAGCSKAPEIGDTGYVGTWERGNERSKSRIAIVKDGESWRFRWRLYSVDDAWKVDCDWEGSCTEFMDGQKAATYVFESWMDRETSRLMVRVVRTGTPRSPADQNDLDVLTLDPGGLRLWSHTIERNGETFEIGNGPRRFFDKVDNAVEGWPPRRGR